MVPRIAHASVWVELLGYRARVFLLSQLQRGGGSHGNEDEEVDVVALSGGRSNGLNDSHDNDESNLLQMGQKVQKRQRKKPVPAAEKAKKGAVTKRIGRPPGSTNQNPAGTQG